MLLNSRTTRVLIEAAEDAGIRRASIIGPLGMNEGDLVDHDVIRQCARRTHRSGAELAIAQRLVIEIGGEITVSSVLGHGTTFRVLLPAATPAA